MARPLSKSHPDHELLTLCAKWLENSKAFDKLCKVTKSDDEVSAFFNKKLVPLFCRIARTKAHTAEGTAAKARVLWKDSNVAQDWPDGSAGKMLRSILREIMTLANAVDAQPTKQAA